MRYIYSRLALLGCGSLVVARLFCERVAGGFVKLRVRLVEERGCVRGRLDLHSEFCFWILGVASLALSAER